MQELSEKILQSLRGNLVVILLGVFLVIDIFSLSFMTRPDSDNLLQISGPSGAAADAERTAQKPRVSDSMQVLKISEIKGPRIDDQAAMVIVDTEAAGTAVAQRRCFSLPADIWIFLLIAYVALLIFNLTYDFGRTTRVQWGFELTLTLLTLVAWYAWDRCSAQIWFPLYVIKLGILMYALYLYFFDKKSREARGAFLV